MRRYALQFLLFLAAAPLSAQTAPATALAGSWQLDVSRLANPKDLKSGQVLRVIPPDLVRGNLSCGPRANAPRLEMMGGVNESAGGGWSPAARPLTEGYGRSIVRESHPAGVMNISFTDSTVVLVQDDVAGAPWLPDGQVRREAQIEGGTLEVLARWKGRTLALELADRTCKTSARRELKLTGNGDELELRIQMTNRFGMRADTRYFFTRVPPSSAP